MFQESTEAVKKAEWKFPKSSIARTQRTSHEYRWTYEERQIRWSQIYERKNKVKKYVNDTTIQRNLFNQKMDLHFCMQKRCYVPIVQYKPCTHLTNLRGVSLTLIYTSNEKKYRYWLVYRQTLGLNFRINPSQISNPLFAHNKAFYSHILPRFLSLDRSESIGVNAQALVTELKEFSRE